MSWTTLIPGQGRRRGLRRFTPERAGFTAPKAVRRKTLAQAGEKVTTAVLSGVLGLLILGVGADLSGRAWVGLAAILATALVFFARYLLDFRREALETPPRVAALSVCLLLPLAGAQLLQSVFALGELAFLPLSAVSLVLALSWSRALACECTLFSIGSLGLFIALRPDESGAVAGLAACGAGALCACLSADQLRRRVAVIRVGFMVGLVQMLVAGSFALIQSSPDSEPIGSSRLALLCVQGLAVGLAVSGSLPAIEKMFGVTTDVSLLELGNTHEQPLLRKLLLEAPGTFHHAYIVGLLSEAAAESVAGNALLARVGALYHDVGKLNKPGYFAENSPEARVRHKELTPEMSSLIICSHTRDGVELGAYYGLPRSVLDFMPEHHGTTCIEYFYLAAKKLRGEEHVNEEQFRYSGPRPQSIETAIVMIADAVEAISRQMPDPSRSRLSEMVHEVVLKRLMDRQFDECGMTLRDLDRIEQAFVRVLMGIYHTRPTYPKGRPHPLDLSQPSEDRRAVKSGGDNSRSMAGGE